jgi:hypothetical protein
MPDHKQAHQPDPAIRAYIKGLGGPDAFAAKHGVSPRNAQRIYSGQRPCPNRLRDEIMAETPQLLAHARIIPFPPHVITLSNVTDPQVWIDEAHAITGDEIRSLTGGGTVIWPLDVEEGDHDQ